MRKIMMTSVLLLLPLSVGAQSSKQAPILVLKDIRGRQFSLSNYKGQVVLLNFWATWCPPCRTEIPELVKIQRQYHLKGFGLSASPTHLRRSPKCGVSCKS